LYIVPTPIGNLGDITARAVEVLTTVDVIAAEDTRHSKKLMTHLDISTSMVAYHEHVDDSATQALVDRLLAGQSVALISDAGTPLVSDPGYRLVRAAQAAHCQVIPLPGACAAIAALSASGLPTDRFTFEGFLPAKAAARLQRLKALAARSETLVFYEAPHRIADCLQAMVEAMGAEREAVLAREISKSFETIRRASLGELLSWVMSDTNQQRGEQVLMVAPVPVDKGATTDALSATAETLLTRLAEVLPPRKAAAIVAETYGLKARDLYARLLDLRGD
jgi:16S rRNA (cytidine1402-2'-O)-methyltransferase